MDPKYPYFTPKFDFAVSIKLTTLIMYGCIFSFLFSLSISITFGPTF